MRRDHPHTAELAMIQVMERRTLLAAGALDTNWSSDGIVLSALPGGTSAIHAIAAAPDGKIVAAGTLADGTSGRLFLARFLHDGLADTTFGDGSILPRGHVLTDLPAQAHAELSVLPNGMIFYVGGRQMARFNPDGSPDATFGAFGLVNPVAVQAFDADLAPDGSIYLSGHRNGRATVAKYTPRGRRDVTWGQSGIVQPAGVTPQDSVAIGVHVMADGKLQLGTRYCYRLYDVNNSEDESWGMQAVRLNPDGTADPTYGVNGVAEQYRVQLYVQFASVNSNYAVFGEDGSTTVTWQSDTAFGACRFSATGAHDATWGGNGRIFSRIIPTGVTNIFEQNDGAMLLVGGLDQVGYEPPTGLKLARLTPTGSTDATFGTNGYTETSVNGADTAGNLVTCGNDGAIYVGGLSGSQYVIARYWRDGAPAVQFLGSDRTRDGGDSYRFSITARDDGAVDASTIDSSDIRILTPGGTELRPHLISVTPRSDAPLVTAQMKLAAPGGTWDIADNGLYHVRVLARHLADTSGTFASGRTIGSFRVRIRDAAPPSSIQAAMSGLRPLGAIEQSESESDELAERISP